MTIFTYVFAFLIAIGVLVAVHEFGHFWMARRLGIRVVRFSIGFGRPLWRRRVADGTEYALSAIPLGGYVKLLDEREGPVPPEHLSQAYNRQPVWRRVLVLLAGPAANFLFAVCAYWVLFAVGVPALKPVIGEVTRGFHRGARRARGGRRDRRGRWSRDSDARDRGAGDPRSADAGAADRDRLATREMARPARRRSASRAARAASPSRARCCRVSASTSGTRPCRRS